ncbi:MAG: lysylphosphatidylglycerol synthase transmembrane domain-containing protein [Actinomycetota bacterium]|nr:lysylphosphatidylglycerol synthase transmembrane domain-containing protein [Actinomycetota bacterium]
MSDDTRTGGAAGSESTLDTPSSGLPTSSTSAPPENGTRGETADLRADALADAGSYVPGSDGVTESGTIVIEDGVIPKRLRRPLDLARFALALLLAAAAVALGWFATGTTSGLEDDLVEGARLLPDPVVLIINIIGGIGTLALPIAGAIALIVRRRVRQLFDALVALLIAVVALSGLSILVSEIADPRLLVALTGSNDPSNAATSPILGGLLAFITASRLISRRPWNVLTLVVMGSLVIVAILSASIAVAGLAASLMLGWAIGLAVRYILGIQTTRPSGAEVADALDRGGLPITMLRAQESTSRGRRYLATGQSGRSLDVTVLDRDLEGAGLLRAIWTSLRLREEPRNSSFNMRRSLEHAALVSYAGESAGVPEPRLLLASEVGPDSCVLAYEHIDGTTFAVISDLNDDDLRGAWQAVKTMHEHQITHRSLNDDQLVRSPDGTVRVIGQDSGSVASSDVAMRIDVAELLCTLAMLTDVDRAVSTGVEILGVDGIGRALPALQPVALSRGTRKELRRHKGLIVLLRDRLVEIRPGADEETIQFERIKPKTLIMVVAGTIAGYVLLSQLAQVDLVGLIRNADWRWIAAAALFSLITYFGSAWSLTGFVPEKLRLTRTLMAQIAGDFATLVSPPTLGSIAINVRYLQKSGLHPALAAASVGVSGVVTFAVHILLLLGFGVAAGTATDFTFDPPRAAVIVVSGLAVLALGLLAVPRVRREITRRIRPLLAEVIPRLVTVAQRPLKLLEGIGGILLLNLAYIAVLFACIAAFGGSLNIALVAVVYLAGATIGQAAPTPGGLGAVEAALAAGLTAAGLDAGTAVSAVLLYRLITFWAPTVPGYWAFTKLTKDGLL